MDGLDEQLLDLEIEAKMPISRAICVCSGLLSFANMLRDERPDGGETVGEAHLREALEEIYLGLAARLTEEMTERNLRGESTDDLLAGLEAEFQKMTAMLLGRNA